MFSWRRAWLALTIVVGVVLAISFGLFWPAELNTSIDAFLIVIIGAVGLNLLTGTAGEPSLGLAALFGVGAFTVAITADRFHWAFFPSIVAACVVGTVVHVIIGATTARLQGLYAILSSLGLQAIVVYFAFLYQSDANQGASFLIPTASIFGIHIATPTDWYVLLLIVAVPVLLGYRRLLATDHGRAWMAIRTRPSMAASLGIPVARYRLLAFAISGGLIAFAGALQAYYITSVSSDAYTLTMAVMFVSVIVVGGLGTPAGCVFGALLISVVPAEVQSLVNNVSPNLSANFPLYEQIFEGALLVLCLMLLPDGLVGLGRRFRRRVEARIQGAPMGTTDVRVASSERAAVRPPAGAPPISISSKDSQPPSRSDTPLLVARDVVAGYPGAGIALNGVSLDLYPGEVLAVVGPNGAGKTTLLRSLSGFTSEERGYVKSGSVKLEDREVVRASAFRHSKFGIALIPEREKVFAELTVYENLLVSRRKGDTNGIARALEPFPALHDKLSRRASLLSGGERQMLALARALILEPKVLLVDETTLGLAPRTAGEVMGILRELVRGADRAIILVEQNIRLALANSDRYLVINRGEVVSSGDSRDGALESHETLLGYGG